jgi:hypothetical protein
VISRPPVEKPFELAPEFHFLMPDRAARSDRLHRAHRSRPDLEPVVLLVERRIAPLLQRAPDLDG